MEVRAESFERSKTDSLANFPHHVKVKVQVMEGVQDDREELSSGIKMPQICTGVSMANLALAALIDGAGILRVYGVSDD